MTIMLFHNYLLSYLHIFINSFLFLHFALEFARYPYRILQINYVDVDGAVTYGKPAYYKSDRVRLT